MAGSQVKPEENKTNSKLGLETSEVGSVKTKKELEQEFEVLKGQYTEVVAEIRYIERLLALKSKKDEITSKMDLVMEQYQLAK